MTGSNTKVIAKRALARDVVLVQLASIEEPLLPFDAGAHIDLMFSNGLTRSYSLTNVEDGNAPLVYEIAVGLDLNSRGGSRYIHNNLRIGETIRVSDPKNHFSLDSDHRRVLLIAGGIGITPIYAMAKSLKARNLDFRLIYAARSYSRMAYLEELVSLCGERLTLHADDRVGRVIDLQSMIGEESWDGVYACGPAPMLDTLSAISGAWPLGTLRIERFNVNPVNADSNNDEFELELLASGLSTTVLANESVLEAIERLGIEHPYSCREGICGTCEVEVIEGEILHRCSVLSATEKVHQRVMMPCVSRCVSAKLAINI